MNPIDPERKDSSPGIASHESDIDSAPYAIRVSKSCNGFTAGDYVKVDPNL